MRNFDTNTELATILENITDAFFALDRQWRFAYLNSEVERVLQRPREELLDKNIWEEFPEAVGSTFYTEYHRAVEEQIPVEFEEYYPPLEVWVEVKAYPSEAGLTVYLRDINRRKKAEEELSRSEGRLRAALVQYGGDLIAIVEADGSIRYISPASEGALGYKPEALVGTNVFERIHPEDRALATGRFAERLKTSGQGPDWELRFQHADGCWRDFEVVGNNLLEDPDVRGIVIHARDVTERKEAEKLLQERSEAIEASIDGVSITDLERGHTYINQAHASMYGYESPDDLLGGSWKALYDEDQARWMEQHAMPALEEKGYWRGETVGKRRDGSTFPQEVSLTKIGGRTVICVIRDATRRKAAERRLTWLASFPELNPSPVVEVNRSGSLTYANPIAEQLFPDLYVLETAHPLLVGYDEDVDARLRESAEGVLVDEVQVGDHFYQRAVAPVLGEELYRVYCLDVTDRKRTEESLRASQTFLYESQRAANIGNWEYHPREDRASWSDQLYRIFGMAPRKEAPSYREFLKLIHPFDRRLLHRSFQETLRHRVPQNKDFRIVRANGEVRWINARYEMIYDREATRAVGTVQDITRRKRTEEALQTSEASLAEAQRVARVGNWEASPVSRRPLSDDQKMRWSDELYRIFGFAPQEISPTFEAVIEATHPEDREWVGKTVRNATLDKRPLLDLEHRVLHPDGEVRTVQARIETRYDETSGRPVSRFGTVLDITDFKRAEETQARLAAIVESSQDAIISETLDGTIESWNAGAEKLYGYSAGEAVGQHISILAPPDLPDDIPKILNRVSRGNSIENRETVRMKKSGERLEISLTVSQLKDSSGNITGASTIARDITGRKTLERQLEHQAFHDALTGLPNRALLEDRLQHALARLDRRQEYIALLFLDLDDFKVVNDGLGHLVGDELLVAVARRLASTLRSEDTVARFSGDEFVILLEGSERAGEAVLVAERIAEVLRTPFVLGDEEVTTTVSVGIAYALSGQDEAEELLRRGDVAMYEAKFGGKGGYRVFEQSMASRVEERQALGNELRRALAQEEFVLHYQPKVELATGRIIGSEALIRWNHPEHGLVPPLKFIPLAEQTGLIVPIGRWVFRNACRQAKEWHEQHPQKPPLLTCVNISAREFQSPELVKEIAKNLRETGADPTCMELEITESVLMSHGEDTLNKLRELKKLGLSIAIDDFGTGYSSLSYLLRMPTNYLKIDRSFVKEIGESPENDVLLSTIINLARSLNIKTVAEGVETEYQLSELKEMGCDVAQGYYFAEPKPSDKISELLAVNYESQVTDEVSRKV